MFSLNITESYYSPTEEQKKMITAGLLFDCGTREPTNAKYTLII